jgi:hypothetical protein
MASPLAETAFMEYTSSLADSQRLVAHGTVFLEVIAMLPLYHESHFTFRFADERLIPRFHLEGVEAGKNASPSRNTATPSSV